jgi:ammonia channel protein AmtB
LFDNFSIKFCKTIIIFINSKIDDASTCTSIHLVNGIWGHLSVGLFADPITGPKSLFVDGSFYRLKIQFVSVCILIAFSFIMTYILIKFVDITVGIRLSEEDEIEGCDSTEHGIEQSHLPLITAEVKKNLDTISMSEKFVNIHTPCSDNFDSFGRRRQFNINESFQRD